MYPHSTFGKYVDMQRIYEMNALENKAYNQFKN